MKQLSEIMSSMAMKSDLVSFKTEIKKDIKSAVSEAVDPVKLAVTALTERVQKIEKNETKASASTSTNDPAILQNISELEEQVKRNATNPTDPKNSWD